jgi:predicted nucleic acid-binding Zn ribbon protein
MAHHEVSCSYKCDELIFREKKKLGKNQQKIYKNILKLRPAFSRAA